MKVIVAGSREGITYDQVVEAIEESGFEITELVSGTQRGVDTYGERWAGYNMIPIKRFFPDWRNMGKRAGPVRNSEMAAYADALIAVQLNGSSGTQDMIDKARKAGLELYIKKYVRNTSQHPAYLGRLDGV